MRTQLGGGELVVKPAVSLSAFGTWGTNVDGTVEDNASLASSRGVTIVQEFLPRSKLAESSH